MAGKVIKARGIPAYPWLVIVSDGLTNDFLAALSAPDFETAANPTQDWAVVGTAFFHAATAAPGTTWVVSANTYKRVKAHRFP